MNAKPPNDEVRSGELDDKTGSTYDVRIRNVRPLPPPEYLSQ